MNSAVHHRSSGLGGLSSRGTARPLEAKAPCPRLQGFKPSSKTADSISSPVDLRRLYGTAERETWAEIPHCRPLDHTMAYAIDAYVSQKLPVSEIYKALLRAQSIEIHGVYPDHFVGIADLLGFDELKEIECSCSRKKRAFNYVRPRYFEGRRAGGDLSLLIAVTPGKDYVRHYAGLVRHFLYLHTRNAEAAVSIFRYPHADDEVATWTRLGELIGQDEIVIVGYVEEIQRHLQRDRRFRLLEKRHNEFYGSWSYALPNGRTILLLGVYFSFWGSIGAKLAEAFCQLGADQVLYVGKLGALSSPSDVYTRIFCPSKFVTLSCYHVLDKVEPPPNPFLDRFAHLDTKCHVSVPTVLEEDYLQRQVTVELEAFSIDNEISQMAQAVAQMNRYRAGSTGFAAIHFATDYVRNSNERHIDVPLNLSNNRTRVARGLRRAILDLICQEYLLQYLSSRG